MLFFFIHYALDDVALCAALEKGLALGGRRAKLVVCLQRLQLHFICIKFNLEIIEKLAPESLNSA